MATPTLVGYLTVRRAVGILGVSLPFLLCGAGAVIFRIGLQKDISSYYHTPVGGVFVGSLFAIAVFLFSYRGYPERGTEWWEISDNVAANVAGAFALGVALFPVARDNAPACQKAVGGVHMICAVGFFLMLAYFCLVLFTKSNLGKQMSDCKRRRNWIYKSCGVAILFSIVWILACKTVQPDVSIFLPETIAVVAFGVSWLVKGRTLWRDV